MDSRNPFSKGFKKLRHNLTGGSRKQDGSVGSGGRGRGTDAEGAGQMSSHLHSEAEGVVIGPGQAGNDGDGNEVGRIDPPSSTPSILHSDEPNST